jgi:DNA polymerase (family 10)
MDPRTVSHSLNQIAQLLELHGENRFKCRAYESAARAILDLDTDDVCELHRSGELGDVRGLGPATLAVVRDLCELGESTYLEQLQETTPEGLIEMMRVPGLGTAKIRQIHDGLGIETLQELEEAARDGRLAKLPRFGPKTADKILKGIAYLRETTAFVLFPQAFAEAVRLVSAVERHPRVERAVIAGSVRRRRELVRDIDIVAQCRDNPVAVAADFARVPGVRDAIGVGTPSVAIRFVDGTRLDLHCVDASGFAVALWRATGSADHERDVREHAARAGLQLAGDALHDAGGAMLSVPDEPALYAAVGLAYVEPELREGRGEVAAAADGRLPSLVTVRDIKGVLHCHSQYSDGQATIAEMAAAAKARGWTYLGISDHSESAFYAGGLSRDSLAAQHEEIDRVNETLDGVRVLKGIEADILADGRVDYDETLLARFDYVIASVHSRFGMDQRAMTERVLRALDCPHVTILGHPTGRLLLTREPYAIDMEAVLEKAAQRGVAVELNADPHRLDIDWTLCRRAKALGVSVEIGPDAHSTHSLDNIELGVGIARKGWLEPADVLNAGDVDAVLARARRHRA